MIFGCISYTKKGFVVAIEGNVNSDCYERILREFVKPFIDSHEHPQQVIFIQDNAPAHKSMQTMQVLQELNITIEQHPPYSPDLNPIEHLWHMIELKIERKDRMERDTLINAIQVAFDKITLEEIQVLYHDFNTTLG